MIYSCSQKMNRSGDDEGADNEIIYNKKACILEVCMIPKINKLSLSSV